MTELALLKMAHILGLVYWLGGDLGVFYSSFFVADEKEAPRPGSPLRKSCSRWTLHRVFA